MKINLIMFSTGPEHKYFCPVINYNENLWISFPETSPHLVPVMMRAEPVINTQIRGKHYNQHGYKSYKHPWKNHVPTTGTITNFFDLDLSDEAFDDYRNTKTSTVKAIFKNQTKVISEGIHAVRMTISNKQKPHTVEGLLIYQNGVAFIFTANAAITNRKATYFILKSAPQTNVKLQVADGTTEEINKKSKYTIVINDTIDWTDSTAIDMHIKSGLNKNIRETAEAIQSDYITENHQLTQGDFTDYITQQPIALSEGDSTKDKGA